MRINNPRLFNGDLLATYAKLQSVFGQNFTLDAQGALTDTGKFKASLIPISGITTATDGVEVYPIFGTTIKVAPDSDKTISAAIAEAAATAAYDANVSAKADEAITVAYSSGYYTGTTGLKEQFTVGLKLASGEKILSQTADGLSATVSLVKKSTLTDSTNNAAEYFLADKDGNALGATIDIPKDQFLKDVVFVDGEGSADDKLRFTFTVPSGEKVLDVDLSGLFNEYTEGPGVKLTATATGIEISGVVDSGADNEFLSIGANGFKVSGVTAKIQEASGYAYAEALTEAKAYTDTVSTFLDGQDAYISAFVSGLPNTIKEASGYAYAEALKDAKTYTDDVSGLLSSAVNTSITNAIEAANTELNNKIAYVSGGVDYVSGFVSGVYDTIEAVSGETLVSAKAYTNTVSTFLQGEIEGVVVSGTNGPATSATFNRLYVDNQKAAYIVPAGSTTPISISMESVSAITAATDPTKLTEVQAVTGYVTGYVEPIKTNLEADISYVSGVVSAATTIISAEVTFGGGTTGQVPGPVLSVYGADGELCSPYVKYTAPSSLLSADLSVAETFVVYYAKNVKNA